MFWYLLNIGILTVIWLWPTRVPTTPYGVISSNTGYNNRKLLCVIGTINWIVLSGLRGLSVGADTEAYSRIFRGVAQTDWSVLFDRFIAKYTESADIKDPGYALLEKLFQFFFNNYQMFLIFVACIFFIPMGVYIYRYSKNPYISFILFSTLFYGFFAITGIRQTIATAIVLWAGLVCIRKNKLIPFILLVLVASTIHASAISFLPIYFISKLRITKTTLIVYWITIITAFIFRYSFLHLLQNIVGYESFQDDEAAGVGIFMLLLLVLAIVFTLTYRTIVDNDNQMIRISTHAIFIACVFSSLLLINPAFMRVVQYYSVFLLFLLPQILDSLDNKSHRIILSLLCVVLMVTLLISNRPHYQFCFAW